MKLPADFTPYSSHAVANVFLNLTETALTNMQVQKLVYIAHGFHLALFDKPLYYHNTHAWQFGPVIPKLYEDLREYGNGAVKELLICDDDIPKKSESFKLIEVIFSKYSSFTGGQLSNLTHLSGTPWDKTWENNRFGIIPIESIKQHYQTKLKHA
jgi:uncharacterized phage-associated protein